MIRPTHCNPFRTLDRHIRIAVSHTPDSTRTTHAKRRTVARKQARIAKQGVR